MCMNSDLELLEAFHKRSWTRLRELSLRPNGFTGHRDNIWPFLLHASNEIKTIETERMQHITGDGQTDKDYTPHPDERQVALDVDRSFIIYPKVDQQGQKATLQNELNELIVSLLRRHPSMHYFQGFHDIISVLQLTLPEEIVMACVIAISKHRLRDSMGKGLEPVIGQLRVLRNLIRAVDPDYAQVLENITPLPYSSLSHLLTLFSHEVPTLKQIQHIFDYLLCREPSASIYLAAQALLDRRVQVFKAVEAEDEGMLHNMLSAWPINADKSAFPRTLQDESTHSINIPEESAAASASRSDFRDEETIAGGTNLDNEALTSSVSESEEVQLSHLLRRTDNLRSSFPRTLPHLGIDSILGTHSVLNTWSQNPDHLLPDEQVEQAVQNLDLIVALDPDEEKHPEGTPADLRRISKTSGQFIDSRAITTSALCLLGAAFVAYDVRSGRLDNLRSQFDIEGAGAWVRGLYR